MTPIITTTKTTMIIIVNVLIKRLLLNDLLDAAWSEDRVAVDLTVRPYSPVK
jgi:hypothetical protein